MFCLFQHQMASHRTTDSSNDGIKTDQTLWPKFGIRGWSDMTKWFGPAHSKHVRFLWDNRHSEYVIQIHL